MVSDPDAGSIQQAESQALDPHAVSSALSWMLEAAHELPPDRLPDFAQAVAGGSGVRATHIFLVDYSQRRLVPYSDPDAEAFDIDGTLGGKAFVSDETVEVARDDGVLLWVPLQDGVDRVGVVVFELDSIDEHRRGTLHEIASLLAGEIVGRGQYTDTIAMARRTQPMSLPAELQWQSLPPRSFTTSDVSIAAWLEPAYDVAGDAFDYAYNDGVLHVAVLDAVGHDLDATLVSTFATGVYRHARRCRLELEATVTTMDQLIDAQFVDMMYATALVIELDVTTGDLRWVNCGHPDPLLVRNGHIVGPLGGERSLPLGLHTLVPDRPVIANRVALEPGDMALVYTDGVVEARGRQSEDFGLARLADLVERSLASRLSTAEALRRLSHAVVDHHGGTLHDDATSVLVHWNPKR